MDEKRFGVTVFRRDAAEPKNWEHEATHERSKWIRKKKKPKERREK